jgi:hypothetical protein
MTAAALSLVTTTHSGARRTMGLALWGAVGSLGVLDASPTAEAAPWQPRRALPHLPPSQREMRQVDEAA